MIELEFQLCRNNGRPNLSVSYLALDKIDRANNKTGIVVHHLVMNQKNYYLKIIRILLHSERKVIHGEILEYANVVFCFMITVWQTTFSDNWRLPGI